MLIRNPSQYVLDYENLLWALDKGEVPKKEVAKGRA